MNRRWIKPLIFAVLLSTGVTTPSPAYAEEIIGRITALQLEKSWIEIEGVYYTITPEALRTSAGRQSFSDLRVGQIVTFSEKGNRIQSLTIRRDLRDIPH